MVVAEASLVPPARLASLLGSARTRAGVDLVTLSGRSNGVFSPTDLEGFERGSRPLNEAIVTSLLDLYQLDAGPIVPSRTELVLDLDDQSLNVGDWWVSFDSRLVDDVLERYLALVHLMRGQGGARSLTLRTGDLEVLSRSLQQSPATIRARIEALGDAPTLPPAQRVLRSMTAIAGAGILVGVTVAGTLVLVDAPADPVPDQIASPLTLTAPVSLSADAASRSNAVLSDRAQSIEALIDWDFRHGLPGWTIVHAGPHTEWRGLTNSQERVVTLFDRPGTDSTEAAAILAHELGHAVDLEFLDDAVRSQWLNMRSTTTSWWADDGQVDFAVGAGDFAEAVAVVLVGAPGRSELGPFTDEQLAFVRDLLPLD